MPTLLSHKFISLIPYKQVKGKSLIMCCLLMCKSSGVNYVLFIMYGRYIIMVTYFSIHNGVESSIMFTP